MNHLGLEEEKRIKDKIIKNISNLFKLRKENGAVKDKIEILEKQKIIRNLLELENKETAIIIYYKPTKLPIKSQQFFEATIILKMQVMVIEIKHCQLRNILIKLGHA